MFKLFKTVIKYLFKRKAKGVERKFEELVQLSKLQELLKKEEQEEKAGNAWKIVLICVAGVLALAGIGYAVYRLLGAPTDDYDLYDDLDNYYVEDDLDKENLLKDLEEADFAE